MGWVLLPQDATMVSGPGSESKGRSAFCISRSLSGAGRVCSLVRIAPLKCLYTDTPLCTSGADAP